MTHIDLKVEVQDTVIQQLDNGEIFILTDNQVFQG